jgi:hypothetical protein
VGHFLYFLGASLMFNYGDGAGAVHPITVILQEQIAQKLDEVRSLLRASGSV